MTMIYRSVMCGVLAFLSLALVGCPLLGLGTWSNTYGGADDQEAICVEATPDGGYLVLVSGAVLLKTDGAGNELWRREVELDEAEEGVGYDATVVFGRVTADGGCIIVGTRRMIRQAADLTATPPVLEIADTDVYLIKLDENGEKEWSANLGDEATEDDPAIGNETGVSVGVTESGYVVAGTVPMKRTVQDDQGSDVDSWDDDVYVATADADGALVESANFGEANAELTDAKDERGVAVRVTSDGGSVVGASKQVRTLDEDGNLTRDDADVYLIRLKSDLTSDWDKTLGEADVEENIASVAPIEDNTGVVGYAVAGAWWKDPMKAFGGVDAFLLKTDENGTEIWLKPFGTEDTEWASCVQVANDGGLIFVGAAEGINGDFDVLLAKTDADGTLSWTQTFGSYGFDAGAWLEVTQGGYIIAGTTTWKIPWGNNTDVDDTDVYLIKTDNNGNVNAADRSDPEVM